MSTIRDYATSNYYGSQYPDSDWSSKAKQNANSFLSGLSINTDSGSASGTISISDYNMIRSGTYGKLMKAYYNKKDAEKAASNQDSRQAMTLMSGTANSMAKSAQALMKSSLWEQKTILEESPDGESLKRLKAGAGSPGRSPGAEKEKNEKGEEVEKTDYDWNAITKAVKSFISDYNKTVEQAGDSNDKNVLRNAAWMTKTTSLTENLLSKAGISITAGNKLELDEDELKNANISDLKSLFTGTNSYASKMFSKGTSISYAAAGAGGTYTSSGHYSNALSELVSGKIEAEK